MIPGNVTIFKRVQNLDLLYQSNIERSTIFHMADGFREQWWVYIWNEGAGRLESHYSGFQEEKQQPMLKFQNLYHISLDNDIWIDLGDELKSLTVYFGTSNSKSSSGVSPSQYPCLLLNIKKPQSEMDLDLKDCEISLPLFYFHNGMAQLTQLIKLLHRYFWLQRLFFTIFISN